MGSSELKRQARLKRKKRIRKRVHGTPERPRLSVFRSAKHIYAQIIDDVAGHTIVAASTVEKIIREKSVSIDELSGPATGTPEQGAVEDKAVKEQPGKDSDGKTRAVSGKIAMGLLIGKLVGKRALEKGIKKVVFDRNGFLYHGRIKAVSDGAREAGLDF